MVLVGAFGSNEKIHASAIAETFEEVTTESLSTDKANIGNLSVNERINLTSDRFGLTVGV